MTDNALSGLSGSECPHTNKIPLVSGSNTTPLVPPGRRWVVWKSNPWSPNSWAGASTHRTRSAAEKALAKLSGS